MLLPCRVQEIVNVDVYKCQLLQEGCTPVDRIKTGMRVEVQDLADPYRMWVAMVST